MRSKAMGPLLIAIAACLWATDALFRVPTVNEIHPIIIVFFEHLIGLLVLLPWIFFRRMHEAFALKPSEWAAAFFIGAGGSAFATALFPASFRYINPSVAILLQKTQPLIVVLLAFLFLRERPQKGFFAWALLALVSTIVLSFSDLNFGFLKNGLDLHSLGIIYAAGSAAIWAISTVIGKYLLSKTSPSVVTFWRYVFGSMTLLGLLFVSGIEIPLGPLSEIKTIQALAYLGLIPGLLALLAYYAGLGRTPASVATFIELLFPISAVIINAVFLNTSLGWVELRKGRQIMP
jgi:drug/metabolite transporter, DME family